MGITAFQIRRKAEILVTNSAHFDLVVKDLGISELQALLSEVLFLKDVTNIQSMTHDTLLTELDRRLSLKPITLENED